MTDIPIVIVSVRDAWNPPTDTPRSSVLRIVEDADGQRVLYTYRADGAEPGWKGVALE